ncbi:hypothetical protein Droror1_Dr00000381 [Drosera rotundifolia]
MKWVLPGLQETEESSSLFCPGNFSLTGESLGLESGASSSYESNRGSIGSRTSVGSHNSRRSYVSSGTTASRRWKNRHPKANSLQPFKLRTEQMGRMKEEEFLKKLEEMMIEEERKRIQIVQGLPWTTDEPEGLIKPSIKKGYGLEGMMFQQAVWIKGIDLPSVLLLHSPLQNLLVSFVLSVKTSDETAPLFGVIKRSDVIWCTLSHEVRRI